MSLPSLMASPPTITDSGTTASLVGSLVAHTDSRFRYYGGDVGAADFNASHDTYALSQAYGNVAINALAGETYMPSAYRVDFTHTGRRLELRTRLVNPGPGWRLRVNGQLAFANPSVGALVSGTTYAYASPAMTVDGNYHFILIDFGTSATRSITFECDGNFRFAGVQIATGDTLAAATSDLGPGVVVLGDSYTDGTGAYAPLWSWAQQAAEGAGWQKIGNYGAGGTGYLNPGAWPVTFRGRVNQDVINRAPDVVIVAGGINDDTYSASAVQAEAALLFAAIAAGLPSARVYVIGPWSANGTPSAARIANNAAIKAAAIAAGLPFIDPIGDAWITNANKATYIGPDNVHPTPAGHAYLGTKVATAIQAVPAPSLSVVAQADRAIANQGDVVTFTLAVTNSGNATATGVSATLDVSALLGTTGAISDSGTGTTAVSWSGLSIASGATKNLTVGVTMGVPVNGSTASVPATAVATNRFPGTAMSTATAAVHVVLRRVFAPTVRPGASRAATGSRSSAGQRTPV